LSKRFSLDQQVAAVGAAQLSVNYVVAASPNGRQQFHAGAVDTLALRAEASFDRLSAITGVTFKVQTGRTEDGIADPTDKRWTDLALFDASTPSAASAVEHSIASTAGKTGALDLFSDVGHRGRGFFRVLVKASGGGTAVGSDSFALFATG
jgi:hypothetical protein